MRLDRFNAVATGVSDGIEQQGGLCTFVEGTWDQCVWYEPVMTSADLYWGGRGCTEPRGRLTYSHITVTVRRGQWEGGRGEKERESVLHPGGARLSAPGNYMQFLTLSYLTLLSTPDLKCKKCINIFPNSKTVLPTTVTRTKLLFRPQPRSFPTSNHVIFVPKYNLTLTTAL